MVPLFCPGCIEIKREIKNREPANLWTSRDELPPLSQDLLQLSQVLWQMFTRNGTLFQICSIILYMHESEINFTTFPGFVANVQEEWDFISDLFNYNVHARI
jgi:hypothetical protein